MDQFKSARYNINVLCQLCAVFMSRLYVLILSYYAVTFFRNNQIFMRIIGIFFQELKIE